MKTHETEELKIIVIILGIVALSLMLSSLPKKDIDCSKPFDVVYLTHDELKYASEISDRINGIVVIPEDNQLIARTSITKCPNFDYTKYVSGFN